MSGTTMTCCSNNQALLKAAPFKQENLPPTPQRIQYGTFVSESVVHRDCEDSSGEQYGIVSHQTYQKEKQLLETWLATKPSGAGQIKRDLKDIQGPDLLSELVDTVLLFVWSFCFALFCFIAGWEHGRKLAGLIASSLAVFSLEPVLMFLFGGLANMLRFSS